MTDDIDPAAATILADLKSIANAPPAPSEWPDAKSLCFQVSAAMRNQPSYRLGMAACSIVDLAYEFAVMSRLVDLFRCSDAGIAKLAAPAIEQLRDICSAEAIRRGMVLMTGDDVDAISLAVELMDEMVAAFTPGWALGLLT